MRLIVVWLSVVGPCALASLNSIAKPFKDGVSAYTSVLAHLTNAEIDTFVKEETELTEKLQDWAKRLGGKCKGMHQSFKQSQAGAQQLVVAQNKRLESLAAESSRMDASINAQDKTVASLQAQVNGKQNEVNLATKNLQDAQNALNSHQRALNEAQKKYDKSKNKCITGRRRKREIEERILRRQKRGWFKKLRRAVAKPFKAVGRAIERGVCRGFGSLTGRIKKLKRLRNNASNARNNAANALNAKRSQLNSLNGQLSSSRNSLAGARNKRGDLEKQRGKLRGELKSSSKVSEDLKAATVFIGSLVVPGKALTEAMSDTLLLDVDTLLAPLNEASKLLTKELKAGQLPHIPRPSKTQADKIKANLAKFSDNLGAYPLVVV